MGHFPAKINLGLKLKTQFPSRSRNGLKIRWSGSLTHAVSLMKKTPIRLAAIFGVILVLPFFVRRRPRVACRAVIRGKPEDIFPLLDDLRNWPRWTVWSQRAEIHYRYSGPPRGVGARQEWSSRKRKGALEITHSTPNQRVAYALKMKPGKHRAKGVFALDRVTAHYTRVTWLARWKASRNPLGRYIDLLMLVWIRRDFARSLANLRRLVETPAASSIAEKTRA